MKKHGLFVVVWMLAAFAGFSAVVMLLWNLLLPTILGVTTINYCQAAGIFILSRILFSGIGGHRFMGMGGMMHRKKRNEIRERWLNMSPEERQEFVREHKFGHFGHHDFWRGGCCGNSKHQEKPAQPENSKQ